MVAQVGLAGGCVKRFNFVPNLQQFLEAKPATQPLQSLLGVRDSLKNSFFVFVNVQSRPKVSFGFIDFPHAQKHLAIDIWQ